MNGLGRVGARRDRTADLDAGELLEEVEMEPRAPKLAVGDAAHPDGLDLADRVGDGVVLDAPLLAAVIEPLANCSRASSTALGRSRLPTWSARNGGSNGLMNGL